jgi:hypothetical protein
MFGHAVRAYFADAFAKHGALLDSIGVDPNNGLAAVLSKVATLPQPQRETVERDFANCYEQGPNLAMVDSGRGITNLHSPSDIIIDASMVGSGGLRAHARAPPSPLPVSPLPDAAAFPWTARGTNNARACAARAPPLHAHTRWRLRPRPPSALPRRRSPT